MLFTCGDCLDSTFALCFTQFEALPGYAEPQPVRSHGPRNVAPCCIHAKLSLKGDLPFEGIQMSGVQCLRRCGARSRIVFIYTYRQDMPNHSMLDHMVHVPPGHAEP